MGQIQHVTHFCAAPKLRMVFIFLRDCFKKRNIQHRPTNFKMFTIWPFKDEV